MTEEQRSLVLRFIMGESGESALAASLGVECGGVASHVNVLLARAISDEVADDVECAMMLLFHYGLSPAHVPLLNALLTSPWHFRHEDVASAVQQLADASSIEALYRAALLSLPYLEYDESFGFARKCTWALARIGTPEAIDRLRLLASGDNTIVADYARKRLR